MDQLWSWVLGIIGLIGFYLAGRKVWWCWYVNIFNQVLWFAYSVVTEQWGFLIATFGYLFVFVKNAIEWTKDHKDPFRNFDFNEVAYDIDRGPLFDEKKVVETKPLSHTFEVNLSDYYSSDEVADRVQEETQWWLNYIGKSSNTPVVLYREESMVPGLTRFSLELKE